MLVKLKLHKHSSGLANCFHSLQNKSQKSGFLNRGFVKNFLHDEPKIMKYFVHIAHGTLKWFPKDEKDCLKDIRVRSQKLVDYLNSVQIMGRVWEFSRESGEMDEPYLCVVWFGWRSCTWSLTFPSNILSCCKR